MSLFYRILLSYPKAIPMVDFVTYEDSNGVEHISKWNNELLGPQPTPDQLPPISAVGPYLQLVNVRNRRLNEYPPIGDQLDAIWKGGQEMEAMRLKILSIKEKFPKP